MNSRSRRSIFFLLSKAKKKFPGHAAEDLRDGINRVIGELEAAQLIDLKTFVFSDGKKSCGPHFLKPFVKDERPPIIFDEQRRVFIRGKPYGKITRAQYELVSVLIPKGDEGLSKDDLATQSKHTGAVNMLKSLSKKSGWNQVIHLAGESGNRYRIF